MDGNNENSTGATSSVDHSFATRRRQQLHDQNLPDQGEEILLATAVAVTFLLYFEHRDEKPDVVRELALSLRRAMHESITPLFITVSREVRDAVVAVSYNTFVEETSKMAVAAMAAERQDRS